MATDTATPEPVKTGTLRSVGRRYIWTLHGKLGLGDYVKAWRKCKAAPPGAMFPRSLCGWWMASREEILAQFSYGVHDRINRHLPWHGVGRKWGDDRRKGSVS